MFLCRHTVFLGSQRLQSPDNTEPCISWFNNVVDVTIPGCIVRIGKLFLVFFFSFGNKIGLGLWIFQLGNFLALKHFNGTFGTHNGNLGLWPCIVQIATQVF